MLLDSNYNEVEKPSIAIIDKSFLSKYENIDSLVIVCNTDSIKKIMNFKSIKIHISRISAKYMGNISKEKFDKNYFEDLAYFEPMYIKKTYVD